MKRIIAGLALALLVASPVAAGKPVPTGTITLNETDVALGDTVTFTVTDVPKNVKRPRIEVLCYQDGALVYGEAGSDTDTFLLGGGGSIWKDGGGPADCVANLFYFDDRGPVQTYVRLASTSFHAEG